MKWIAKSKNEDREIEVDALLWFDAREIASRLLGCSAMDLEVEPVEKPARDP